MTDNSDILYFEINTDPTLDINARAGEKNSKTVVEFKEHAPFDIVCYDFDYATGSFMYLDQIRNLRRVIVNKVTPP